MKKLPIFFVLLLCGCAGNKIPEYRYENAHKIDGEITQKNTCIVIDNEKTTYKWGHMDLGGNPFRVGEGKFDPGKVSKTKASYDYDFDNDKCKNPITIRRAIEVSSISYPDICWSSEYVGTSYHGATTSYNSFTNTTNTSISGINHYKNVPYNCIKTSRLIEVNFYKDKTYLGQMQNQRWNESNESETIDDFTAEFIKITTKGAKQ